MFDGAGRSMNELLIIFIRGWDFRMLVIYFVLVVEIQRWFFVSLVVDAIHAGIMIIYVVSILSIIFIIGFVGFSSKPSPIYGGVGLIVSGGVGCGIIVSFGGSFLGLMVPLIYLGGTLVVSGHTTAMATEQYPEAWVSNMVVLGSFVIGLIIEFILVIYVLVGEKLEVVLGFNEIGDWAVYDVSDFGVFTKESIGVAALYSYGNWLVVVTGWSLLIGVVIILEITRGS